MQHNSSEYKVLLQDGRSEVDSDEEISSKFDRAQVLRRVTVSCTFIAAKCVRATLLVIVVVCIVCSMEVSTTSSREGLRSGSTTRSTAKTSVATRKDSTKVELVDVAMPAFLETVQILQFIHAAFPGELSDLFLKWSPTFKDAHMHIDFNCGDPYPSYYFNNKNSSSYGLFHNLMHTFPMAMEYMDTSYVERPMPNQRQAVLGFAEMLWPYFSYNGDLASTSPYLVVSMDANTYSERMNFEFVECALLGWPTFSQFNSPFYPLRVVLKNPWHGLECLGWERGHASCNLHSSWGLDPANNNWRNTVKEVNALFQLCMRKYNCEIKKVEFTPMDGKQIPQIFLFRVLPGLPPALLQDGPLLPLDRCGFVERDTGYGLHVALGSITNNPNFYLENVITPEKCCAACQKAPKCKAWMWMRDTSRCWLSFHHPNSKVPMLGCVSGQPGTTTTTTSSTTTTSTTSTTTTTTTMMLAMLPTMPTQAR